MVRIMIMATMHDMTTTTIIELRMLNQCTCTTAVYCIGRHEQRDKCGCACQVRVPVDT